MMNIKDTLFVEVQKAVKVLFDVTVNSIEIQETRREFEGDITVVVFSLLKLVKGNPLQIGESIGEYLVENVDEIIAFNVVKGFLNLSISNLFYVNYFNTIRESPSFGVRLASDDKLTLVEYASPNTNKPLHLGHIRNILLGYSVAEILKASGKNVNKTQIINDRGIHICKSMLAWKRFGKDETPKSSSLKGDKFVGHYYVEFDKAYKNEVKELVESGIVEEEAKKQAPLLIEAQGMLRKWESGDEKTISLWKTMNQWVYDGFEVTYKNLGVDFNSYYYESNTYLLGKDFIYEGLEKGVFFKKEDGSVWCDLTNEGLDEKLVLRSDGTSVYMTQDIGTAIQRYKDYPNMNGMVYTVANEQDYHFKVLFLILKKLGFDFASNLYHLSYGMVDLPSGKMKSREGTVVDADDIMEEMVLTAKQISQELGKLEGYSEDEKEELYHIIGLGALKYFLLKVDPKKRILFDPKESIDFQGNTGPFIQYTYARIQSIIRKATTLNVNLTSTTNYHTLNEKEKDLIKQVQQFPDAIQQAAQNYSPALIANYTYDLVKSFNSFYQNVPILGADKEDEKVFRVQLCQLVGEIIKRGFGLLGIQVPERM